MNIWARKWQAIIGVKEDGWFGKDSYDASLNMLPGTRHTPRPTAAQLAEPSTFKGAAKRLDDIDLPRIGVRIGVGEDEIHAVIDVETAGGGFDGTGRPRMLFEPHIFYRHLSGAALTRAMAEGLAYQSWGRTPYPSDSYPRLQRAILIDREAALKSASWGLGQIMGFNAGLAGFDHVEAMVSAFLDDEEVHLEAMVTFIIAAQLDDELRSHDWAGFARGYNGAAYARHGYHTRLAAAYERWRGIKDTPLGKDDR